MPNNPDASHTYSDSRDATARINDLFIGYAEVREGRVPTNDEIKRYGSRELHPDHTCKYLWKGEPVLSTKPVVEGLLVTRLYGEPLDG